VLHILQKGDNVMVFDFSFASLEHNTVLDCSTQTTQ